MATTIYVPRVGGGTLILTVGTVTPSIAVTTNLVVRDGNSTLVQRDGTGTFTQRDGSSTLIVR